MGKAVTSSISRQAYLFLLDGRLAANVGGVQRSGSITDLRDGEWHHAALVVSNSSSPRTYTLYVDGVADGVFSPGDNVNGADFLLGARRLNGNSGSGFPYSGALDEVAVFDTALSAADVGAIYGGGAPSVLGGYATDGPSIRDTTGVDLSAAAALTGFSVVDPRAALPHGFRLSPDGSTWYFFDGAAWTVTAGGVDGGETSDAAAVNDHIGTFVAFLTPGAERLFVEAVLHSDGADAASIGGFRVHYDALPATSAVEVLGPIAVGQGPVLEATIVDEDPQHFVTVQALGPDAATPIDDAELPGNGGGFTSAQLAAGVALDAVNADELYLRLRFTGAGGGLSAGVDELRLRFDAPSVADLTVSVTAPPGLVLEGEPTSFRFTVENRGPGPADDVELLLTMPTPVQADDLPPVTPPAPWGCFTLDDAPPSPGLEDVSFLCVAPSLPAGAVDTITVPVQLRQPFSGFSPLVATAEVRSSNDVDPSNDRAAGGVAVDAPPRALLSVEKVAEPADGTDFDFLFNGTDPFVLDARFSDDFDDVESFEEFWVSPGTYTVEELTPATSGWQLDSIF
ncbi:MAG: LamG-like jellyroll fold domain-containing protein, partial [Acidobacteriota bacterium]